MNFLKISSIPAEVVNVVLAVFFCYLVVIKKNIVEILFLSFAYCSLHFISAVFPLFDDESEIALTKLHVEGGGLLAKLSASVFIFSVFLRLCMQAYSVWQQRQSECLEMVVAFLLAMGFLFAGYIFNIHPDDDLQLKNIISMEVMLVLLLVGYLGAFEYKETKSTEWNVWVLGVFFILLLMDGIAIFEVATQRAWARTLQSSGELVIRASAALFNPNLFAFWGSLVCLGCVYAIYRNMNFRKFALLGVVLTAASIYFSGSRSAIYILLGVLFFISWMVEPKCWLPMILFISTIAIIYIGSKWIFPMIFLEEDDWSRVYLLGDRFLAAPMHLIDYSMKRFFGIELNYVPSEIELSIGGRFDGVGRDAGWLVLYHDAGWIGVLSLFLIVSKLFRRGWGNIRWHTLDDAYTLGILLYFILTGFVMRFQIFPVWFFIGISLILCMLILRRNVTYEKINCNAYINS